MRRSMSKSTRASRHLFGRFACILTMLVTVSACVPAPQPQAVGAPSGLSTVNIRLESDWPHIDVTGKTPGGGIPSGQITAALYDSLVFIGPDPQDPTKPKVLPYLATSWDQT